MLHKCTEVSHKHNTIIFFWLNASNHCRERAGRRQAGGVRSARVFHPSLDRIDPSCRSVSSPTNTRQEYTRLVGPSPPTVCILTTTNQMRLPKDEKSRTLDPRSHYCLAVTRPTPLRHTATPTSVLHLVKFLKLALEVELLLGGNARRPLPVRLHRWAASGADVKQRFSGAHHRLRSTDEQVQRHQHAHGNTTINPSFYRHDSRQPCMRAGDANRRFLFNVQRKMKKIRSCI